MRRAAWRGVVLALALVLACGVARADKPIALFKSFAGNVNFVGTQKTMRTKANNVAACEVTAAGTSVKSSLAGIPAGATILSAQLYWAGSNSSIDTKVVFEGAEVVALPARQYLSHTIGAGFDYFGAAADVTPAVAKRHASGNVNGSYTFSGLTIRNGTPYCAVEGVLGGFALLVVYADPAEQFRVLNLYEGFQFIRYSGVTLTLRNFRTPNPLGGATARVSHITWEGDRSLGANGEDLLFNNFEMFDNLSPKHNQFNSASNINADAASYGIDFDAYTVGAGVIGPGQTKATTRYQSGQDLVLLNAEIIAMPNVPTADLSIAITRNSALVQGRNASYTLSVANAGPNVETGPVVVVDTLPVGMAASSASGDGWSCAVTTRTFTCSHAGSLAVGGTLPPLTVIALVSGSGTLTNTASVSGKLFDNVSENSIDTDSAATEPAPPYAFTDSACVSGQAFGAALQTCNDMAGAPLLAGASLKLYITALSGGVPTLLSTTQATTVAMGFALSCHNPASNAGVKPSFAGASMPLCTPNRGVPTAWSGLVNLVFAKNAASAPASAGLVYADVGKVQLFLRDAPGKVVGAVPFVSKPASLAITAVVRSADSFPNPQAATGAGNGFAKVGQAFTIKAAALTTDGAKAPNFGNEGARLALDWKPGGDGFALAAMVTPPTLDWDKQAGDFTAIVDGEFTGNTFTVDEVGILAVTPRLSTNDYLGAGAPGALTTNIGRFYPDHFKTTTAATMECLAHMLCPVDVSGAAYAGQPFAVTVTPLDAEDGVLLNYNGVLARPITLSAFSQPGGTTANPSAGSLSGNIIPVAAKEATEENPPPIMGLPVYGLPRRFSNSAPRARNWVAPTALYLRAGADENIANGGIVKLSSLRPSGSVSVEGGIMIVSGRLALDSPHGSELARMPVRAEAQYWASTGRWETAATDNISTVQRAGITFANCLLRLKPCDTTVLKVTDAAALPLKFGAATFWLAAPGAGKTGSAQFQMNDPAWLPSAVGRAVFGVYKSPLIYLREVY
jgi:MSHA biogenesis protein MshQ